MNLKNRRERADYSTSVVVKTKDKVIEGPVSHNISLNGIYIETSDHLPMDSHCQIEITLGASSDGLKLQMDAKVVRNDDKGIGLTFEIMDIETFRHLKNIVLYNSDDPSKFVAQCDDLPGFKLSDDDKF